MASSTPIRRGSLAADTLHISELPIGILVDVSAYLAKPSRAILAVVFSPPSIIPSNPLNSPIPPDFSVYQSSPISKAIISASQWDILDFEDVEKKLANKLLDNDIYAILKSINAHDVLKRLKLCGCINITGRGLIPLRDSVVLEQIDISLVGKYESPIIDLQKPRLMVTCGDGYGYYDQSIPRIRQRLVMPILESIIWADGCSLKHVQFPYHWRNKKIPPSLKQFQSKYNQVCCNRGISCTLCEENLSSKWLVSHDNILLSDNICYDCLTPFCRECCRSLDKRALKFCNICKKDYCGDCLPHEVCSNEQCEGEYSTCARCKKTCDECDSLFCEACLHTCDGCSKSKCSECEPIPCCTECGKKHCADCYDGEEYNVRSCDECGEEMCLDHLVAKYKSNESNESDYCNYCAVVALPIIVKENAKLSKDNKELGKRVFSLHVQRDSLVREKEEKEASAKCACSIQ